jgi:hypothetical protein
MQARNVVAVSAVALALVPAAACGGNGSANGSSAGATVTSRSGTTSATGSVAGHGFSAQIASLGAVVDRLSNVPGSAGSGQVANDLTGIRRRLTQARSRLSTAGFPAAAQPEKHQLMTSLDRWSADLNRAEATAREGHAQQALRQAQSPTYRELKSLLDAVRSISG